MFSVSQYEDSAAAFLADHPVGTVVTADRLFKWANDHGNGLASDMLIGDPGKRFNALRRHLNHGGESPSFDEKDRFHLAVTDAKRKTLMVVALADHVTDEAKSAFGKCVVGAISPLARTQRAIDAIKLQELDDDQRKELEDLLADTIETMAPMKSFLSEQVVHKLTKALEAKGFPKAQAKMIIEMMPTTQPWQKLIKMTS